LEDLGVDGKIIS